MTSSWRHAGALAFFAFLAVVLTWPLARHLGTHLPGTAAGDNVTFAWNIWWMRHALSSASETFFYTDWLMFPYGADLTLHTHTALPALVAATLFGSLSIVSAQNLIILSSYTLNGFCAYLLGWSVARNRGAALLAGVVFAAAPYFAGHLYGHFNLVVAWGIPLYLFVFFRALRLGAVPTAGIAGGVAVLTAYTDYYYAVFLVGVTLCIVAYRWFKVSTSRLGTARPGGSLDRLLLGVLAVLLIGAVSIALTGGTVVGLGSFEISMTSGRNLRTAAWGVLGVWLWRRWRPWVQLTLRDREGCWRDARVLTAIAGVFLVGTFPLLWNGWQLWLNGSYVSQFSAWRSAPVGIDVATLVVGGPFHPLWGSSVTEFYRAIGASTVEGVAWFGLVPILVLFSASRSLMAKSDATQWIVIGASFFVWALGPYLLILGVDAGLPLPASLLRFVPVVSNARIPGRAIVVVYLAVAMLLALWVAKRPGAASGKWAGWLGLAVLIDFLAVPIPLHEIQRPAIYSELAALPPGAVLELPLGVRDGYGEDGRVDHDVLYYQSLHGKPLVGGFVARLPELTKDRYRDSPVFGPLLQLSAGRGAERLEDFPLPSAAAFEATGVHYVVVNTRTASARLQQYIATVPGLRLLSQSGGRHLYTTE